MTLGETLMQAKRIAHIGIAVADLDHGLKLYQGTFGMRLDEVEDVPEMGVKLAFLSPGGGSAQVELLAPTSEDSVIARFIEKRGEGLHHCCFEVADVEGAMSALASAGYELVDKTPRERPKYRAAFIHPKSMHGCLIEIVEMRATQ
jgi:methylmalonyl-CoA epimerase